MPRGRWFLIINLIMFSSLVACTGLASEPEIVRTMPARPTIDHSNPDQLGEAVFTARCASCHGIEGRGDGAVAQDAGLAVPNFTRQATSANQSLAEWTNTIRFGRLENMMPPWQGSLSEEEIAAVADYTYTLWQNFPQDTADIDGTPQPAGTAEPIPEEALGSVSGTVQQGTADMPLPDVISVALQVLDEKGNEYAFDMQVLEGDLAFQYDDLLIRADYTYFVSVIHDGVVFYSDIAFGTPADPQMQLPVTIYETTSDESVIQIDLFVLRLIADGEEIIVQQLVNFNNTSDRVYRGDNQLDGFTYDSVRLPLPDDMTILNSSELVPRFLMLEGEAHPTLLDTQPVLPVGDHIVEVVYALPFTVTDAETVLTVPTHYTLVQPIEIMTQPSQFSIVSDAVTSSGIEHLSIGVYESFLSDPIMPEQALSFDIRPPAALAAARPTSSRNSSAILLALGGVGLLLLSGVFLFLGRNQDE